MKVTVITAALNARDDLVRTRASLLAQHHVDVQHVIVDGGSTDGTLTLLAEWQADGRTVCFSEGDSGVYQAFNKGLRLAEGDCIGFLNAGDVYQDENVLSDVVAAFRDADIDLIYGDVDITRRDSIDQTIRRYKSTTFSGNNLLRGLMPPHPSIYARRRVYDDVGEFSEVFRIAGDFEWALRAWLIKHVSARHLDRVFVRMPTGGISNNGLRSIVESTVEMHRALEMHDLPVSWLKLLSRLPLKWLSGR